MNIMGNDGYYASVMGYESFENQISWGFNVRKEHGTKFTIEFANKLLDFANREYKKGCPEGYKKEAWDPDIDFDSVEYDMTDYKPVIEYDGHEGFAPVGKKKIGRYYRKKNLLEIYENRVLIYVNNNGTIYRPLEE